MSAEIRYHHIAGEPGLVKDCHTKAILSTDHRALTAYRQQRDERRLIHDRLNSLEARQEEILATLRFIVDKLG
jgi:hypothetical protein